MAQTKNTYYFSHDCNARLDEKMLAVRIKHGVEGYGVYFMLIERLAEAANHRLNKDYEVIAFDFRCSADVVKAVVENFGLFSFTDSEFYSESLLRRMAKVDDIRQTRRESGKKGGTRKAEIEKNVANANDLLEKNVANANDLLEKNVANASDLLEKNVAKERKGKEIKGKYKIFSSIEENSSGVEPPEAEFEAEEAEKINYAALVAYWNKKTKGVCGKLENIENNRRRLVKARIMKHGKRKFQEAIDKVAESSFLLNSAWFNFDWFIRPNNFDKIITGNYDDKDTDNSSTSAPDTRKHVTKPTGGGFTADF